MAPFSVAVLKEKASNAKTASSDKFQSVRKKYVTTPSRSTVTAESSHWHRDPDTKASQPAPQRTSHEGSQVAGALSVTQPTPIHPSGPPPPLRQASRPVAPKSPIESRNRFPNEGFKWASISNEDKGLLFSWFDEFFATRHPVMNHQTSKPVSGDEHGSRNEEEAGSPHSERGSTAQDFSDFFSPTTEWDVPWYSSHEPTPPPLARTSDGIRTHTIQWGGDTRTLFGAVLFSDLSACWYTVTWADRNSHDTTLAKRTSTFAPIPSAMSRTELLSAHETYGETIASFAEGYEGTGQWCGRGECWDLASEALKAFEEWDYVPKPLPSIGTTHGHLIYEGNSWGRNSRSDQAGLWRGGDDRIRRGDIIQWKSVKLIDGNQHFILGSPDHTAIIMCDQRPPKTPMNNQPICPADLGSIEVVEQSINSPPTRQVYNLKGMVSGKVWIYRPVGMEAYLKFSFSATCPEGF